MRKEHLLTLGLVRLPTIPALELPPPSNNPFNTLQIPLPVRLSRTNQMPNNNPPNPLVPEIRL